jgi:predicted membrane-bound spermidine synthase
MHAAAPETTPARAPFLAGVFLISFSMLVFQIVQTRILSVIAWYYMAFFAISVAMLGMTIGAVRVYLARESFDPAQLARTLCDNALICAISMPVSLLVQLSLITTVRPSLTTLAAWTLLLTAMTAPYVFAGIAVSLALTRSPFAIGQVYATDLAGAALGCVAVVAALAFVDAPSAILLAGGVTALSALCFARSATAPERESLAARSRFARPPFAAAALFALAAFSALTPYGARPLLTKDSIEAPPSFERWNSYSRITAEGPLIGAPTFWSQSPLAPPNRPVARFDLKIDGAAGTTVFNYDGTTQSIDFLRYDLVNLAYNLPGIRKSAVIGVGGGRDILSARLFGVTDITGVELNPIFIDLHKRDPRLSSFSNLSSLSGLRLVVDDARSWFTSTDERFDLIQMSMIDTWAATGAGAFTLSENGLYTLEGWRTFVGRLTDSGVFTVSRWYSEYDVNEAGRMIALAAAVVLDSGARDARPYMFVANSRNVATLVLSKRPFTAEQIALLRGQASILGWNVLVAPDQAPRSPLLAAIVASPDLESLDRAAASDFLDLSVPTDDRPFFFNQLRFSKLPEALRRSLSGGMTRGGVIVGNLVASGVLVLILALSIAAVIATILVPLRGVTRGRSRSLVAAGSAWFAGIGMGFMFAEISLLQYFSVYLGHPIYSLSVCLFSLILATGLGSLASDRVSLASPRALAIWAALAGGYLLGVQSFATEIFHATAGRELAVRIAVSLAVVMPLGFLLGFAFPTGMKLVERIDPEPAPWFWGINGATGVLASVLAVMVSMSLGIRVTMALAGVCYLALVPAGLWLIAEAERAPAARESVTPAVRALDGARPRKAIKSRP